MQIIEGIDYLDEHEVADHLGLSNSGSVRNQRSQGRSPIPYLKVGQAVRYKRSDVEAYVRLHGRRER